MKKGDRSGRLFPLSCDDLVAAVGTEDSVSLAADVVDHGEKQRVVLVGDTDEQRVVDTGIGAGRGDRVVDVVGIHQSTQDAARAHDSFAEQNG